MKYIKLFEAFQSTILSKTLGYLDKWSKPVFLEHVKKVCKEVDFPISELNDDYFQYLPFKKALKVIETDGVIWKYWLDTDGKLVEISKTDGEPPSDRLTESPDGISRGESYNNRGDYLSVINPKSGDWMWFKKSYSVDWELGKVFRAPFPEEDYDDFIWFLGNEHDGSVPPEMDEFGNNWGDYGYKYSWGLYNTDFYEIAPGYEIKKTDDKEINYNLYNKVVGKTPLPNIESQFAIVFHLDRLVKSEYKKGAEIKVERERSKSGATALISDEDIRKANMEKRLMELSKKELNIDNFDTLFQKTLFDKWILFFDKPMVLTNIDKIVKIFEGEDSEDDGGTYTKILQDWYSNIPRSDKLRNDVLEFFNSLTGDHNVRSKLTLKHFGKLEVSQSDSMFLVLKKLHDYKTDLLSREMKKGPNTKKLSNKLEELGQLIINKIKPNKFNDIDDVVISVEKLKSIYAILTNKRYDFNRRWDSIIYFSKGLNSEDIDETTMENYIMSIDKMIELVNKL
jgi:hypothetical protein